MGKGKQLVADCENVYEPCVIVHGGAWACPVGFKEETIEGVQLAASAGYKKLLKVISKNMFIVFKIVF